MTDPPEVPVAEFKRNFHRYAGDVQRGGMIRVTSHGRAVGDFVPSLRRVGAALPPARGVGGFLSVIGLFAEWESIESDMRAVIGSRGQTRSRPVPNLEP